MRELPHFNYYLGFLLWVFGYFLFNNQNMPSVGPNTDADSSIALTQFSSFIYCFIGIGLAGVTMFQHPSPRTCFDRLNKTLLWVTAAESLVTILCYPLNLLSMQVDGFHRAAGLFTHPNPFAHHMGILLIYELGLFCYYQGPARSRLPGWLIAGAWR